MLPPLLFIKDSNAHNKAQLLSLAFIYEQINKKHQDKTSF